MALLPLSPKDCSKGAPLSPNWTPPAFVKQRILPAVFTTRSPFRITSPEPSAPQSSWRTLGHFDASMYSASVSTAMNNTSASWNGQCRDRSAALRCALRAAAGDSRGPGCSGFPFGRPALRLLLRGQVGAGVPLCTPRRMLWRRRIGALRVGGSAPLFATPRTRA